MDVLLLLGMVPVVLVELGIVDVPAAGEHGFGFAGDAPAAPGDASGRRGGGPVALSMGACCMYVNAMCGSSCARVALHRKATVL